MSAPDRRAAKAARQLTLDLTAAPSFDPDDFLESPSNAEALAAISRWPAWPHRAVLHVGPSGCGKSHLAAIWAERAGARRLRPGDRLDPGGWPAPIVALIEDCDHCGMGGTGKDGAAYSEADLFHLLNRVREDGGWLLLTARTPPTLWGLRTQDLLSRLRLAPGVEIGRPDLALMNAVIVKLFADRQIRIDADVVAYAARHCERSLEAINRFVAAVDEESLAAGRRITRPLAAAALSRLAREAPDA